MMSTQGWIILSCFALTIVVMVISTVLSETTRMFLASGGWIGLVVIILLTVLQGLWTLWGVDCAVRGEYGWHCGVYAWIVTIFVVFFTVVMLLAPIILVIIFKNKIKEETEKLKSATQ